MTRGQLCGEEERARGWSPGGFLGRAAGEGPSHHSPPVGLHFPTHVFHQHIVQLLHRAREARNLGWQTCQGRAGGVRGRPALAFHATREARQRSIALSLGACSAVFLVSGHTCQDAGSASSSPSPTGPGQG